jgi:hypothetical protein
MTDYLTMAHLVGDLVVYRNLQPYDASVPGLAELRERLGVPPNMLPRKRDADYARVVFAMLQHAQAQRGAPPLKLLLVLGDTNNDRLMAQHLRTATGLPVAAFIGAHRPTEAAGCTWEGDTATATRWTLLDEWLQAVGQRAAVPWNEAALLVDIDKTLLGPRGRYDHAIDEARAEAALRVAQVLFGPYLDADAFNRLYATLCQSDFHALTLDNQDYTVYTTMLLARGVFSAQEFAELINSGKLQTFGQLLDTAGARISSSSMLAALHQQIAEAHAAGDPTPFKDFRRTEFAATVARMADGRLPLSRDVMQLAQGLVQQGALCFAASDKPVESALPTEEQAASGLLPLHRMPAHLE